MRLSRLNIIGLAVTAVTAVAVITIILFTGPDHPPTAASPATPPTWTAQQQAQARDWLTGYAQDEPGKAAYEVQVLQQKGVTYADFQEYETAKVNGDAGLPYDDTPGELRTLGYLTRAALYYDHLTTEAP